MPDSDSANDGILGNILAATATTLSAELRAIRAGFNHSGIIGTGAEEIVAKFLNNRLPGSARAIAGQAIDHKSRYSKQLDVIIYDTTRTPMLFTSPGGSQNLVPAEGVIAVVEVKTKLNRKELRRSILNCASVKELDRSATLLTPGTISFDLYGQRWPVPPIYYSVFAFESDGLYAETLNDEMGQDPPLHERIDSLVCLDRGVCLNASVRVAGTGNETTIENSFSASPEPGSVRMNIKTDGALAAWYGVFMSTVLERIPGPVIDIAKYLRRELQVTGTVEGGAAVAALSDRLYAELADAIDISPQALKKLSNPASLTIQELYELLRHPMYSLKDGVDPLTRDAFYKMQESARELLLEEWIATWFCDQDSARSSGT